VTTALGGFMKSILARVFFVICFLAWPSAAMDQCPDINQIKKIEIVAEDMIQVEPPHHWIDPNGFPRVDPGVWKTRNFESSFGTEDLWEISFDGINAFSNTEAARLARERLSRMTDTKGPYAGGYSQVYYYCIYENPELFESAFATSIDR
jgi:hypothetical protein